MNTLVVRGVALHGGNQKLSMVFVIQESKTLRGGYLSIIWRFNRSWLSTPSILRQAP
jgi:hypothetical protein